VSRDDTKATQFVQAEGSLDKERDFLHPSNAAYQSMK
jgi:hypothetical protein